ncbi:uncharacterized protein [Haliotis cracherodii]|uniref:uncharacterized protein n=1 Tax=Haliotis cracherodii TaxID=6455 RepID=UPI0039E925B1
MVLPICKGGVWDSLEVYAALYCTCCFVSQSRKTFLWDDYDDDEGENESKTSPSPKYTTSPVPSLTRSPVPSLTSRASKIHVKPAAGDSTKPTHKPASHGKPPPSPKSDKPSSKVAPEVMAAPKVVKQRSSPRQISPVVKTQVPTQSEDTAKKEEDTPKRKPRVEVDMNLLQRLLAEDWFPSDTPLEVSPAVEKLLEMLAAFGKTPVVHGTICDYIVALQEETPMMKPMIKKFQECLLDQLTCEMSEIRSDCVRTLRDLGMDSNDIITAILPKLVDPSRGVRQESVIALVELTGVKDKESLADLLHRLGVTRPLMSSEDEENALKILRDKIGLTKQQSATVIESFHDWVSDWVNSSIPGVFEGEEYMTLRDGEEAGVAKRVKIVSPDSEEQDSSLEKERRDSTSSHRQNAFSKRRPSRSVKPGGKSSSALEEKKPDVTEEPAQTQHMPGQGRQPTEVSDQLSGGRKPMCAQSPMYQNRNTPEPDAFIQDKNRGNWTSETTVLLRVESRFRPKGGSGISYPEPHTEGSGRSRAAATDSGRATLKGQRDSGQVLSNRLIEYARMSSDKDSDLHSLSMSGDSDHQDIVIPTEISQQTEIHSQEGLSFYDSGIGISDSSQGNRVGPGGVIQEESQAAAAVTSEVIVQWIVTAS